MAAKKRIEYHWIENRIVSLPLSRPKNVSAWRFNRRESTLIATIEPRGRSFYLRNGPAATDERIIDCIRDFKGFLIDHKIEDFSKSIPKEILDQLSVKLNDAVSSTLDQWNSFAEETDVTGYLKGRLSQITIKIKDWIVSTRGWTYKRYPKEDIIGADLGIIFDIKAYDHRVVKAVWFQAKILESSPKSLSHLPNLKNQIEKMKVYTDEAYTLIYTKEKIDVCRGMDFGDLHPFSKNLLEGVSCFRGDRNPVFIANTVDVKQVVTFFLTGPEKKPNKRLNKDSS